MGQAEFAAATIEHIDALIWRYHSGSKLKDASTVIDHLLDLRNVVALEGRLAGTSRFKRRLLRDAL